MTANVADNLELVETGRADAARAEKLFPNQGLHAAARAFGTAHPRAVQYLEQAPVLILGVQQRRTVGLRRINSLYIQHMVTPFCERGAPLADVMRAFHIAPTMRRLKASALSPSVGTLVLRLSEMDPRFLGNVVPPTAGKQRTWLKNLRTWREVMHRRGQPSDRLLEWAAENTADATERRIRELIDFIVADQPFNPAWGWNRAEEETTRWHSRITVERTLRGSPFTPDTCVDMGKHPDAVEVAGYDFVALRTPFAIAEEGAVMQHCVGSYIGSVVQGACHIVSVRRGPDRLATIEVGKARIQQIKGKRNSTPPVALLDAAKTYVTAAFAKRGAK